LPLLGDWCFLAHIDRTLFIAMLSALAISPVICASQLTRAYRDDNETNSLLMHGAVMIFRSAML